MLFADPKSDIAFKKIFGDEKKTKPLISFLNAVMSLEGENRIEKVTILNPHQAPKLEGLKYTLLDIKAVDETGKEFIVEMQMEKQKHIAKRVLYYTSKAYVSQIDKGDKYS